MKSAETIDFQGIQASVERHERRLPVADFDFSPRYKDNCRSCSNYGRNLSCPPFSPGFSEYVGGRREAKVICLRLPLSALPHLPAEARPRAGYELLVSRLTAELLEYRKAGHRVAGAGECKACRECPLQKGEGGCIKPDEQLFSLESLGVNLSTLVTRSFDFSLEWNALKSAARHVCAVGALFLEEEGRGVL